MRVTVIASHARPTDTGVEDAMDVDIEIEWPGVSLAGEVTIAYRNGEWSAYGDGLDHWVDSALIRAVEDATVPLLRRNGTAASSAEVASFRRQLWDEVEAQAARECREAKAGRS